MKMKRIILYNISLYLELHCYSCFISIERTNLHSILGLIIYCPFDCNKMLLEQCVTEQGNVLSTRVEMIVLNKITPIPSMTHCHAITIVLSCSMGVSS